MECSNVSIFKPRDVVQKNCPGTKQNKRETIIMTEMIAETVRKNP